MGTTKCDIIRDMAAVLNCGLCEGKPTSNCPAGVSPVVCSIPSIANDRMELAALVYNPANILPENKAVFSLSKQNYATAIQNSETELGAAYPDAEKGATSVSWPDLEYCLWNLQGTPAGTASNVYFGRKDALDFGMVPPYPVGGTFAQGSIWKPGKKQSPVPLTLDYIANPDLIVIIIFTILVIIFAVLIWKTYQRARGAPRRAEQQREAVRRRLEASDPYQGTAFESYPDPLAKCRNYVETMESQGYNMTYYRQKCGLPEKED